MKFPEAVGKGWSPAHSNARTEESVFAAGAVGQGMVHPGDDRQSSLAVGKDVWVELVAERRFGPASKKSHLVSCGAGPPEA